MAIHTSLRPQSFSGLAVMDRGIATAAMKGSLLPLRLVVRRLQRSHKELGFLPVLYHLLDPSKIPSDTEMDRESLTEATLTTITAAFLALEGLSILPPPLEAHADLWPRVWPWVQFLDVYHPRIPEAPTTDVLHSRFFSAVVRLMHKDAVTREVSVTTEQIVLTPRVGVLMAQAMGSYYRNPNPVSLVGFRNVAQFLLVSSSFRRGDFAKLIEGAGGEASLATFVVHLLNYVLTTDNTKSATAVNLACVLRLCVRSTDHTWMAALFAQKGLQTIFSVLLFLEDMLRSTRPAELHTLREPFGSAWATFTIIVLHNPGYIAVAAAIDAGVIPLVVSIAQRRIDWTESFLRMLVVRVLLPATVYYPILSRLQDIIPALKTQTDSPAFVSSFLHEDWDKLVKITVERLEIKRKVDSGTHVAYKACDNLDCAKIRAKSTFKRCSGCEFAHYCSKECQIIHWRSSHRKDCDPSGSRLGGPDYCTARDRSLLHAIVSHDYEQYKEEIFLSRIVQLREHGLGVATLWDYSEGRVKIGGAIDSTERARATHASLAGARMHINCINFWMHGTLWVVPTRYSDSRVNDTLWALSQLIPTGTVEDTVPLAVRYQVRRLINEVCPSVLEIM
ncbi:hypothetical protein C8R46DRAFT_1185613 [Mycena filopes]|nr:hypothetical protein C8R46DRAFT_1185613 [Mycena filopes]